MYVEWVGDNRCSDDDVGWGYGKRARRNRGLGYEWTALGAWKRAHGKSKKGTGDIN